MSAFLSGMVCGPVRSSPGKPVEKVVVTGGWADSGPVELTEIYDVATNKWETGNAIITSCIQI